MSNPLKYNTIKKPILTDKTYKMGESENTVVFSVDTDANKFVIKDTVEKLFDVKVESVRTANKKGKMRRVGRIMGKTNATKKAYVKLQAGHDINFMEE